MRKQIQLNWIQGLLIVAIIWLVGALCDRLWFNLDHTIPAWDQADYLNGAINYWKALQTPHPFDEDWWRSFWLISSKIPPLTYILTVPFFHLFGISVDSGTLVMLLFSAMLLFSVYGLGVILFNIGVGIGAALFCLLMPGLYYYRLEFLLDFPLAAIVTFCYFLLTFWQFSNNKFNWIRVIAFGLSLGLGLLVKQTVVFFLFLPILWALGEKIIHRRWHHLIQLVVGLLVSVPIFGFWYRTNWLLMLTAGKRATVDSALIEGDPSLNSIDAWTYYFKILPFFLSWVLLLVPLVGLLMSWLYWRKGRKITINSRSKWIWLGVFLLGGYLLSSLNINKDARYILPLLPTLSVVLAVGLLSWQGRWQKSIRWGTIGLAFVLMGLNLFPLGGDAIANIFSPKMQHHPYTKQEWQHENVIKEITQVSPYLRSTLGVLPSTPQLNQHNFSFYGGKYDSQVKGRQVGVREKDIEQDAKSLDWFVSKTDYQGSISKAQTKMVQRVERGKDFDLQKQWLLPDNSTLSLYHQIQPSVTVKPVSSSQTQVQLKKVIVPQKAQANTPIGVTYIWQGSWEQLRSGLVLLTWQQSGSDSKWLHDHGIGMGRLYPDPPEYLKQGFEVTETTAMLPNGDIQPGNYTLTATYLNRQTGETYPIAVPPITLTIDPTASPIPAPELDLVTQLRVATADIGKGIKGIEPIFALTGRINQYDVTQDYVRQTDRSLSYRLKQPANHSEKLKMAYGVAISRVLQQDVEGAITAIQNMIELDANNPYHHAYLAFVYLYDWRPHDADKALQRALQLDPSIPELKMLSGVAALMQGNLWKAWNLLHTLL